MGIEVLRRYYRPLDLWFMVGEAFFESLREWPYDVDEDGYEVEPERDHETGKIAPCSQYVFLSSTIWKYNEIRTPRCYYPREHTDPPRFVDGDNPFTLHGVSLDDFMSLSNDLIGRILRYRPSTDCTPIRDLYLKIHQSVRATERDSAWDIGEVEISLRSAQMFRTTLAASRGMGRHSAGPAVRSGETVSPPPAEKSNRPRSGAEARVLAAAVKLKHLGKKVSVSAACKEAGADRRHFSQKYPNAVKAIRRLGMPDGDPIRQGRDARTDRRTGEFLGTDGDDD